MNKENDLNFGFYHVYNRGVRKNLLFHNVKDYSRFILLVLIFQYNINISNINRLNEKFSKNLNIEDLNIDISDKEVLVEVISFCIMPNHFHLILNQFSEGGVAKYMQKVLTAYTMYYNKKYKMTGHAFQGKYKSVFIEDDEQLIYLSIYVHKNPIDINEDIFKYKWSSLQDLLKLNRWGSYLKPNIITDRYGGNLKKYEKEIIESPAKTINYNL